MAHILKFKTGQTVIDGYGNTCIIIHSRETFRIKYVLWYGANELYDESDSEHTIYAVWYPSINGSRGYSSWLNEPHIELYCTNTKKGKSILRDNSIKIMNDRGVSDGDNREGVYSFKQSFEENETDTN